MHQDTVTYLPVVSAGRCCSTHYNGLSWWTCIVNLKMEKNQYFRSFYAFHGCCPSAVVFLYCTGLMSSANTHLTYRLCVDWRKSLGRQASIQPLRLNCSCWTRFHFTLGTCRLKDIVAQSRQTSPYDNRYGRLLLHKYSRTVRQRFNLSRPKRDLGFRPTNPWLFYRYSRYVWLSVMLCWCI